MKATINKLPQMVSRLETIAQCLEWATENSAEHNPLLRCIALITAQSIRQALDGAEHCDLLRAGSVVGFKLAASM